MAKNDQQSAIEQSNQIRNDVIGPALIMRAANAAPEAPALYFLWRGYNPPDLRMQRNEGYGNIDPEGVKKFYKTGYNSCTPQKVDVDTAATANYYLKMLDFIRNHKGCYDVGNGTQTGKKK